MHQYPQRPRPDDQPSYPVYPPPGPGPGPGPEQGQSQGQGHYQDFPGCPGPPQQQPYQYEYQQPEPEPERDRESEPQPRRSRRRIWIGATVALALLLGGGGFAAWKLDWFSGNGEAVSFGKNTPPPAAGKTDPSAPATAATPTGDPDVLMPTGPKSDFKQTAKLEDGTIIAKTRLTGAKSGFEGNVWVWAPKEYDDPKYAKSAFPVLISLPGGNGFPDNYWSDRSLGLQKAISDGAKAGTSLPFVVIMPVLNPDAKYYYDGSDIPGQAKMGTWIAEDVPDFAKANFRTYKSRDGWAFMGSSSGAFVGMKTVLQHPDRFKAVIASGGEIVPDSPLWKGHQAEMDANNPEKLAQKLIDTKGPEVYINFQIGTKESGKERMTKFQQQYGKGPVKMTIRDIQNGEHNGWHYVRGMKEGSLEWVSKVLKGPKPEAG
ncbi:alpha/beta hydrolase [Streptomyces sp. NPDC059558]|uniref:alpha/beta hydrolase n=1 Tax=Streptomyces sp. NPDC059558 TaxID=3346864 RepID=UPI003692AA51